MLHEAIKTIPLGINRIRLLFAAAFLMVCCVLSGSAFGQTSTILQLSASTVTPVEQTSVTLTASISPSTATGFVSFYDGSVLIGTVELPAASSGSAVLKHVFPVGSHNVIAHYSGTPVIYLRSTRLHLA